MKIRYTIEQKSETHLNQYIHIINYCFIVSVEISIHTFDMYVISIFIYYLCKN